MTDGQQWCRSVVSKGVGLWMGKCETVVSSDVDIPLGGAWWFVICGDVSCCSQVLAGLRWARFGCLLLQQQAGGQDPDCIRLSVPSSWLGGSCSIGVNQLRLRLRRLVLLTVCAQLRLVMSVDTVREQCMYVYVRTLHTFVH